MESKVIDYLLQAIEELEDYSPLLERQDCLNQTVVTHSIAALRQTFTTYKQNYDYGTFK